MRKWDKKYLHWGVTAFLVVASSIIFNWLLMRWSTIRISLSFLARIFSPFIWGLAFAFLMTPLMTFFDRKVFLPLSERIIKKNGRRRFALHRALSILMTFVVLSLAIYSLLSLILPQVYASIQTIVSSLPEYFKVVNNWSQKLLENNPTLAQLISSYLGDAASSLSGWAQNNLMPKLNDLITNVYTGVFNVIKELFNVLIGIVVSCYLLFNKETYGAQLNKVLYSLVSTERAERFRKTLSYVNKAFMGFLSGKVLDALIVGILCYIGCTILRMPYPMLVSVMVGTMNIIPFFGPLIGMVPSALIILMVSPMKAFIFLIFILAMQQVDANIIEPRIMSNKVGLDGLFVILAITISGGLFGFVGLLLGVPVFAVCLAGLQYLINKQLKTRGLSTETSDYALNRPIRPEAKQEVTEEDAADPSPSDKNVSEEP